MTPHRLLSIRELKAPRERVRLDYGTGDNCSGHCDEHSTGRERELQLLHHSRLHVLLAWGTHFPEPRTMETLAGGRPAGR